MNHPIIIHSGLAGSPDALMSRRPLSWCQPVVWGGLILLLMTWANVALVAAQGKVVTTNQPPAEPVVSISVFVDDPQGRDPFFPNSKRRFAEPDVPRPVVQAGPQSLRLSGIIGTPERPYALINNMVFTSGEQRDVRVAGGGRLTIRCVEIRERSVLVLIENGTELHEIQMPEFGLSLSPQATGGGTE